MAKRYELNDQQWARIADMLPGKKSDPGRTARDNRLFVDGVLWVLRSGAQWDELPERYGKHILGRSRGGLTTKIHLLADALGRPLRFLLTGGQVHESQTAEAMLDGVEGDAVIADKAYDSNAIRQTVKAAGMKAVIPANRSRKKRIRHDKALYRERNRIERCFNKLKHFRRLATRYDRRARHFLAFLCLAASILWMR
jgi:transposase